MKKYQHINNIDYKEIKKFDKLSSYWWNASSVFQSLHCINSTRLNYILNCSHTLVGKKILDVGCGGGILTESMAKEGAEVTGIDISESTIETAKNHALKNKLTINYIKETIEIHANTHINHYDVITCMEVLEHVPYPLSIIHACSTIIKKKGSVFFSTLNRTCKSWLLAIIGAEYILKIIPKGTHDFNKFITPHELINWINSTDLKEKNITGVYYNPITNKCYLTQNLNINYIIHTQK